MRRPVGLATDLLVVDVGNSKVQGILFAAGVEAWRFSIPYESKGWSRAMGVAARVARLAMRRPVPALVANVAPRRAAVVENHLRRHGLRTRRVSWRDPWPFALAVSRPESVGVDRLANIAGLLALGLGSGIAIDVGTAVTIDVLQRRRFLGGLIMPGGELLGRALHAHTALLPAVAARANAPLLGTDTHAAVEAGISHGLRHAVAGTVSALRAHVGGRATVVLTGGGAELVAAGLPAARLEPDLLVLGLRLLSTSKKQT